MVGKVRSLIHSQWKPPDVVSCYLRNTSPCRCSKQITGTSGGTKGRARANDGGAARCSRQQVGERVFWQRRRRESPCIAELVEQITQMHTGSRISTHTQTVDWKSDVVTLTLGPFGPLGGIGHMIAPQRSSAVCRSNSVLNS